MGSSLLTMRSKNVDGGNGFWSPATTRWRPRSTAPRASHGSTCEASSKRTTSNGNAGDSRSVLTASGLLIQHGMSRTSRFGTRAKICRNGRCRFFLLTSAGWPDLIRQLRLMCHCFGVLGEAVPMECQRPITLLLRGLRSSGTRQFQKRHKPGHPARVVQKPPSPRGKPGGGVDNSHVHLIA